MAIDEVSKVEVHNTSDGQKNTGMMIALAIVVVLLVVGQVYTLNKLGSLNTLRASIESEDGKIHEQLVRQLNDKFSNQLAEFSSQNAQQLDALRTELDAASKRAGSAGRELKHARAMVAQLQTAQEQEAEQLKQQIDQKADQQQVGALSQDMTATRSDLSSTKKTVDTLSSDLGMARSELGTLIARNHDDIEALRKLGERDYFEFTLNKGQESKVAGVGLILKKTNVKHNRFNLALLANDMAIDKNNRTTDEPIFFTPGGGQKRFYEIVVNKVSSNQVTGYLSTPKGVMETASAGEGTRP
jgi:multidrug efflux pump subunit AcrA (membrane-fusion protein)